MAFGFNEDKSKLDLETYIQGIANSLIAEAISKIDTTVDWDKVTNKPISNVTISDRVPLSTEGDNGDIWLKYEA